MTARVEGARQSVDVCVLGKVIYPYRVAEQQQDMATYVALRPWARRIYLVVTSRGARRHLSHYGNVVGLHVPLGQHPVAGVLRFWLIGFVIAWRLLRRRRVALLMAAEPLVGGPLALLLRRMTGVPVLVHIQGNVFALPRRLFGTLRIAATRRMAVGVARRADRVRCISREALDECRGAGIPDDRLVLLPPRCDFDRFDPARWTQERAVVRAELAITDDELLILSIGSLTVHKGYGVLLEAFARLRGEAPHARLVIVGAGPLEADLRSQAERLGVASAVRLAGAMPYARVPALLAAADVYTQPSFDEGIPRATLEAMAMRVPVVASRVGGIPDVVVDGQTGVLVDAGDVAALAAALGRLVRDPERRRGMAAVSRESVQPYSMQASITRLGALLHETAGLARSALA